MFLDLPMSTRKPTAGDRRGRSQQLLRERRGFQFLILSKVNQGQIILEPPWVVGETGRFLNPGLWAAIWELKRGKGTFLNRGRPVSKQRG